MPRFSSLTVLVALVEMSAAARYESSLRNYTIDANLILVYDSSRHSSWLWTEANNFCDTMWGTTLATIHTASVNQEAINLITSTNLTNAAESGILIGYNLSTGQWADGSTVEYTNWADGQPFDDCAMLSGSTELGEWSTIDCSIGKEAFFCNNANVHLKGDYLTLVIPQQPKTWHASNEYCMNTFGTTLVTIQNPLFDAEICQLSYDNLGNAAISTNDMFYSWIGYNDISQEGVWVWKDLSTSNYTNWNSGEPNNYDSTENCASMVCNQSMLWKPKGWNDYYCDDSLYTHMFVCNRASLPTDSPTLTPTLTPTLAPSLAPTLTPSLAPTLTPSLSPTPIPTLGTAQTCRDTNVSTSIGLRLGVYNTTLLQRILFDNTAIANDIYQTFRTAIINCSLESIRSELIHSGLKADDITSLRMNLNYTASICTENDGSTFEQSVEDCVDNDMIEETIEAYFEQRYSQKVTVSVTVTRSETASNDKSYASKMFSPPLIYAVLGAMMVVICLLGCCIFMIWRSYARMQVMQRQLSAQGPYPEHDMSSIVEQPGAWKGYIVNDN